jgi:hypothetical protein
LVEPLTLFIDILPAAVAPMFFVLKGEAPNPAAMICALATSIVVFGLLSLLIALGGRRGAPGDVELERTALRQTFHPRATGSELNSEERDHVLSSVIHNLQKYYFDHAVAQKMADKLAANDSQGEYYSITDSAAFATLLTGQVREVSHDMHLDVVYSESPLPDVSTGPTTEDLQRYRRAMLQENCTFQSVAALPHNIGYVKLDVFPDPSICGSKAQAVMASLDSVNAIIIDLRDNRGGAPGMVKLIASYLFDRPEPWYNPREARLSWTSSPVPRNRLADKPVYVLTSSRTISGAEQFCYDLKMLKRATLVGETTHGSAHAGVWHRIDDHFGMGIPEIKAVNPYSTEDWEGLGVAPTVKVKTEDALAVAEDLACKATSKR